MYGMHLGDLGDHIFCDAGIDGVRGEPAVGFYRLLLRFRFRIWGREEARQVTMTDLRGLIHLLEEGKRPRLLGRLEPAAPPFYLQSLPHQREETVELAVHLQPAQLEELERVRDGGDIQFGVEVSTWAAEGSKVTRDWGRASHVVRQGDWLDILRDMEYRNFLLLEVPMPDDEAPEELKSALQFLRDADMAIRSHRPRDAVASCRRALEALAAVTGIRPLSKGESINLMVQTLDKEGRYAAFHRALIQILHAAMHGDQSVSEIQWDRVDGRFALTAVCALFNRTVESVRPQGDGSTATTA